MTVSLCKVQRLTSLRCRSVVNAMPRDRWLTKEEGTKQTDIVSSSAWWLMGALGSFVNPSITTWLTRSPRFWSLYFMTGTVTHVFLRHGWHFTAPEGAADLVSKSIWRLCHTHLLVAVWSPPYVSLLTKKQFYTRLVYRYKTPRMSKQTKQRRWTLNLIWSETVLYAAVWYGCKTRGQGHRETPL